MWQELHSQEIDMKPILRCSHNGKTLTICTRSHDENLSLKILYKSVKKCGRSSNSQEMAVDLQYIQTLATVGWRNYKTTIYLFQYLCVSPY